MKSAIFFEKLSGPEVELPSDQGLIDLHAYMSFKGFTYSIDRILVLRWNSDHLGAVKVKSGFVKSVDLVFVGVHSFSTMPRDPEIPFDADKTLDDFLITQQGDHLEITLNFNGGMSIIVMADDGYADLFFENEELLNSH